MNDEIRRYLVVSDFHLTSGKDPETGRWSATEDFFDDETFAAFLNRYNEGGNTTLIFNGDLCDFIQVLAFPSQTQMDKYGILPGELDRAYGLQSSEAACAFQMDRIMDGHETFFRALADFLIYKNSIVILKGNHDIQFAWERVQRHVRERLRMYCRQKGYTIQDGQLEFPDWFFLVPGVLYAEHGNQFEDTTAFRHFLYPRLPVSVAENRQPQLELDLSSFLVRYLTNRFEPVNPLADNVRPLSQYYETLLKRYPYYALTGFRTALKYVLKAFGKARAFSHAKGALKAEYDAIVDENRRRIAETARRFAPQGDAPELERKLLALDAYATSADDLTGRPVPTLEQGAYKFAWSMIAAALKKIAWIIPLYILSLLPGISEGVLKWIGCLHMSWLTGAVEFLHRYNILHAAILFASALSLLGLRGIYRKIFNVRKKVTAQALPDVSAYMRTKASHIAALLGVRYVTFGHTHYADTAPLENGSRYFNTGTWMAVFDPENNLYSDIRQYTYLLVADGTARLMQWRRDANAPRDVAVVDTQTPLTEEEDGIIGIIVRAFKRS